MEFCPTCGMLLRYEQPNMGQAGRFYCPTCPYFASIESRVKIKREQKLAKKEIEPIFTLEDMKKGGAETDATCPHCNFGRACFQQIQIRSADEPATTFYFCLNDKCGKMWRWGLIPFNPTIQELTCLARDMALGPAHCAGGPITISTDGVLCARPLRLYLTGTGRKE
ncbi:hypothetical protein OIU84_002075 [Salix udensis]|uniref:DNA-directed RNA polymerase III subunit RPC10 n=1 Tax=Salix udensis TaxID=889485 RepID=A0AAD6K8B9_9ROSI|nr:hypothetical protein OIU84_002075 [Salix udensis]